MGQTIDSHMNYEGISQTPLQRRIEQRVSNGLGYSDQHNCSRLFPSAFPARLEAEPVKVYSGDRTRYEDSNRAIQTSLMLLDIRAGIHHELEYTHLNQLPPPPSNFGYDSLSLKKNQGPLGRLGDRLRLAAATVGMSFAPLSERRGFYSGPTFKKDLTPRDEGSFFKKDLTPPDENSLPLCPKPGIEYIPPYDDLDSYATLRRIFERDEFKEKSILAKPALKPQHYLTHDSDRTTKPQDYLLSYEGCITHGDEQGERKPRFEEPKLSFEKPKVGFEEPQTCDWKPAPDVVNFIDQDGSRVSVTLQEPQNCELNPVPDDSNLTPLSQPFVEPRNSPWRPEEDKYILIIPPIREK